MMVMMISWSLLLGCGKTTLATQLCHDEEIKEKFAYIFFCVVLSVLPLGPLYRLYSITAVTKHQKDSEAVDGLRKLIAEVKEDGPILLCWMMFEFPSFGPAYHFETFGRGARSLLIERASPHSHLHYPMLYEEKQIQEIHDDADPQRHYNFCQICT
ncbi:hypothetical protein Bca4012_080505 [Brassica carinata]